MIYVAMRKKLQKSTHFAPTKVKAAENVAFSCSEYLNSAVPSGNMAWHKY